MSSGAAGTCEDRIAVGPIGNFYTASRFDWRSIAATGTICKLLFCAGRCSDQLDRTFVDTT